MKSELLSEHLDSKPGPAGIQGISAKIYSQLCLLLQGQEKRGNLLQIPKTLLGPSQEKQSSAEIVSAL